MKSNVYEFSFHLDEARKYAQDESGWLLYIFTVNELFSLVEKFEYYENQREIRKYSVCSDDDIKKVLSDALDRQRVFIIETIGFTYYKRQETIFVSVILKDDKLEWNRLKLSNPKLHNMIDNNITPSGMYMKDQLDSRFQ